ncbi:hypothetical protein H6P81_015454 [Aristolochia fimbriata]|uniref:TOD1/MUCI70 glycosyltransferase-like domain-containing protein n=1 Tax=Aristolochia fimbriata TaxID=158543 RepID=A0AAV7E7G4_ARIFI|nr:hypothetical protein H6P81_015454 [Aristolochia fimbriata]
MAQYRQSGVERFGVRGQDYHLGNGGADQIGLVGFRVPHKHGRIRRFARSGRSWKVSITAVVVILGLVLVITFFAYNYISGDKEFDGDDVTQGSEMEGLQHSTRTRSYKVLKFGQGSVHHGRDSRYWDRDDRRRDKEYDEDASELNTNDKTDESTSKSNVLEGDKSKRRKFLPSDTVKHLSNLRTTGLYNEAGRDELKHYEKEYEASLKIVGQSGVDSSHDHNISSDEDKDIQNGEVDSFDEYDDGIDLQDSRAEESYDGIHENDDKADARKDQAGENLEEFFASKSEKDPSTPSKKLNGVQSEARESNIDIESSKKSSSDKKSDSRRRGKKRKYSSSSCEMKFLNSTAQLVEPLQSRKFTRFSLQYAETEDHSPGVENWEPRFGGHQSLQEREESFYARDQKINCGFVKGPKESPSTGFDLAEDDIKFMHSCHIAVSSCIFGSSDNLRSPTNKMVTRSSRKIVCFVMFVDESTLQTLVAEGQMIDRSGFIGLWKIVVVKNLPYDDMRRVGKIPKFLTHRLFPSARYSIWLDSKLRLQKDPLLILEYFLWRKNYEYAISNHYDRHCLWEEVAQNKKLNKFNHTIIDQQFEFYRADGLKRFNVSDPNKLLPSYVPEGSFIVRAHTPMSNLFSCLWFNEVDRFTPRDQLSFAYTYLKLRRMNPEKPLYLNMFKDCERRSIAKLFHHRPDDKRTLQSQAAE